MKESSQVGQGLCELEDLSLDPQHPCKRFEMVAHICKPDIGAEMGESWSACWLPVTLKPQVPDSGRDHASKPRQRRIQEEIQCQHLTFTCAHTTYMHTPQQGRGERREEKRHTDVQTERREREKKREREHRSSCSLSIWDSLVTHLCLSRLSGCSLLLLLIHSQQWLHQHGNPSPEVTWLPCRGLRVCDQATSSLKIQLWTGRGPYSWANQPWFKVG